MAKLVNLAQHSIRIRLNTENKAPEPDATDLVLEPSGIVARASAKSVVDHIVNDIPVVKSVFGEPENLPDPQDDTVFVGSTLLAQKAALMGRTDVVSPNTAPKQDIRDENGFTFAVFGFQTF
jgi:hypothetical protein